MNKHQYNYMEMTSGVQVFLTSLTATNANPALVAKLAKLKTHNERIIALSATQGSSLRAKRESREVALNDTIDTALLVAGSVLGYARTHRLTELAGQMRLTRSDFLRLRRPQRVLLARRVLTTAQPVVAELAAFGTTPALLDELETQLGVASVAVDATRDTAGEKKTATEQLRAAFQALTEVVVYEIDPLLAPLRKTNPEVWTRYQNARQVMDRPGTRSASDSGDQAAEASPATAATAVAAAVPAAERQAA